MPCPCPACPPSASCRRHALHRGHVGGEVEQIEPGDRADRDQARRTTIRSRFRTASRRSPSRTELLDNAVRPEMKLAEMRVPPAPVVRNGAGRLGRAACIFRLDVLEAMWQYDLARDAALPVTGFLIGSTFTSMIPATAKRPVRSSWFVSNSIALKSGSWNFSVIAAATLKIVANGSVSCPVKIFRIASRWRASARSSTMARASPCPSMNRPRPRQNCRCLQPIEFHVAEMSLVDAECDDCPAIAARGQGVELARAPPIAIAARDLGTFDTPICVWHRNPPGVLVVILAVPLWMRIRQPTICDRKRGRRPHGAWPFTTQSDADEPGWPLASRRFLLGSPKVQGAGGRHGGRRIGKAQRGRELQLRFGSSSRGSASG